jgi:hypothetical protein
MPRRRPIVENLGWATGVETDRILNQNTKHRADLHNIGDNDARWWRPRLNWDPDYTRVRIPRVLDEFENCQSGIAQLFRTKRPEHLRRYPEVREWRRFRHQGMKWDPVRHSSEPQGIREL